jgi:hypothetical protein
MERFEEDAVIEEGFRLVIVLKGEVEIQLDDVNTETWLKASSTTLLRYADGSASFTVSSGASDTAFVVIRPPLPGH